MRKIKLFLAGILILGTGILNADGTFTEYFTTTTIHIDTYTTTALVDKESGGEVRLPLSLSLVGSETSNSGGMGLTIKVQGGFAYADRSNNGLMIFDVTNPANIPPETNYNPVTNVHGVDVQGDYAYVSADTEFEVVDISSPTEPVLVGSLGGFTETHKVFIQGNRVLLTDANDKLYLIDISTLSSPTKIGSGADISGGDYAYGLHAEGKYAYVSCGNSGLDIFEITDSGPSFIKTYDDPSFGFSYGIYVSSSYAYIASGDTGLQIVDVHMVRDFLWLTFLIRLIPGYMVK